MTADTHSPDRSTAGFAPATLLSAFATRYSDSPARPRLCRSPGRLNLLGEHTDYNQGFVLPIAIDRANYIAFAPAAGKVRVFSQTVDRADEFSPADFGHNDTQLWSNYVRGVLWALGEAGVKVPGGDLLIGGDLPLSGGVSSSASLETACALAFLALAGAEMPARDIALLCQKAENEFVGVHCGIMDQFAVGLAAPGHALLLDCRSLETENVPLAGDAPVFFLCDTGKSRELAASEYNIRRAQCEAGAKHFGAASLRDVSLPQVQQARGALGEVVYRRCRHVLTENARVQEALPLMARGDWPAFGELLSQSHASLRDDYEVSCRELDVMSELAEEWDGCLGARMVGAGFGGCAMAALRPDKVEGFAARLAARYRETAGREPVIFAVRAGGGASLLTT